MAKPKTDALPPDAVVPNPDAAPAEKPRTIVDDWTPPTLTDPPTIGYVRDESTGELHLVFVPARWVDTQAVFNSQQGLIRYGDPFWVSAEQLEQDPRLAAWSDDFTPDPDRLAVAMKEG
jgi:hypothetical protein